MTILPVIAFSAVLLLLAYFTYGRWVMRWLGVDPARKTPAVELEDGNDYVPAAPGIVLGGHFTAIAAAGPVVGPILAGIAFGWAPALAWILLGAIFVGAVHDSGALLASVRHKALSITQVVREHMSRTAYLTFLAFVWISLLYVIVAFTDVVAGTFSRIATVPAFNAPAATASATATATATASTTATATSTGAVVINGGAVAIGATAYLAFSLLLGLALRFTRLPWYLGLLASCAALAAVIHFSPAWATALADAGLTFLAPGTLDPARLNTAWELGLLAYCFLASVVPLWLLLQPRGTIGATFLYVALAFGVVGTLVGGWASDGSLAIRYPAFTEFSSQAGYLFPVLFITIACGACSGFHSIVASGTTSRQIRSESDVKPVAYGAMLLEAMVAVFALSCVMVLAPAAAKGSPDVLYAQGIGNFMALCGIPLHFAVGFGLLAFSSFVFDTLDVCTRLGRYVLQELLGLRGTLGAALATLLTIAPPAIYLVASPPGAFRTFWTLFGTSNQLLAALTLVGVSVWLHRTGRPVLFALIPAAFMLLTTATALTLNLIGFYRTWSATGTTQPLLNAAIALTLLALAALVTTEALRTYLTSRTPPTPPTPTPTPTP